MVSDRLYKVLIDPMFRSHIALVVVDKPWFAYTATLDPSTFRTVCKLAGFEPNIQVIKTPIDRPELKIIQRVITAPEKKDFRALYFTITAAPVYSHTASNSD